MEKLTEIPSLQAVMEKSFASLQEAASVNQPASEAASMGQPSSDPKPVSEDGSSTKDSTPLTTIKSYFEEVGDCKFEVFKRRVARKWRRLVKTGARRPFYYNADMDNAVEMFARWMFAKDEHIFLYICGLNGTGKSTLVKAFQRVVNDMTFLDKGLSYEAARVCRLKAEEINERGRGNDKKALEEVKVAPFLIIDEFAKEDSKVKDFGNEVTPVKDVVSDRYEKRRPTVFVSNAPVNVAANFYGIDIKDRFMEVLQLLVLEHPSYRAFPPDPLVDVVDDSDDDDDEEDDDEEL